MQKWNSIGENEKAVYTVVRNDDVKNTKEKKYICVVENNDVYCIKEMNERLDNDANDEELAVIARRDPAAFGILMERYESKLLRYIMRLSHSTKEDAEDTLQESYLKAYQKINDFDASQSFSSWIYRIVHNTTISGWRKRNVRPHGHSIDVEESFLANIAADDDVVIAIDQEITAQRVQEILTTMDEKYRDVLILRYMEDQDYKEISDILKKPPGTVATLLHRAKKQFAQKLSDNPIA